MVFKSGCSLESSCKLLKIKPTDFPANLQNLSCIGREPLPLSIDQKCQGGEMDLQMEVIPGEHKPEMARLCLHTAKEFCFLFFKN